MNEHAHEFFQNFFFFPLKQVKRKRRPMKVVLRVYSNRKKKKA